MSIVVIKKLAKRDIGNFLDLISSDIDQKTKKPSE